MGKTQVLFFPNQKDKRVCLFKCSTISLLQWLNSSSFAFVNPILNLGLGNGICDILLAWSVALKNAPKLSSRDSISFSKMLTSSLRINRCCYFESQKWNFLNAKHFLLDPLLKRTIRWWECEVSKMLDTKNNYLRLFRPKILLVFLRIRNKVRTSCKFAFW